jgi:hypothetical protein
MQNGLAFNGRRAERHRLSAVRAGGSARLADSEIYIVNFCEPPCFPHSHSFFSLPSPSRCSLPPPCPPHSPGDPLPSPLTRPIITGGEGGQGREAGGGGGGAKRGREAGREPESNLKGDDFNLKLPCAVAKRVCHCKTMGGNAIVGRSRVFTKGDHPRGDL